MPTFAFAAQWNREGVNEHSRPDSHLGRPHAEFVAPGTHATIIFALPHLPQNLGFLAVERMTLAQQPQHTLCRIAKRDSGRVCAQQRSAESQFASDYHIVFIVVTEADVVGGIAQLFQ